MSSTSNTLSQARAAKNDEFYTRLVDIEEELQHYTGHFLGKSVFLNCDNPEWSNFWKYFECNFESLGLSKLTAIYLDSKSTPSKYEMFGPSHIIKTPLLQDGDFRSPESLAVMKESDIVVTNPPFSLFREFLGHLIENDKKFLVLGNQNAITHMDVFPLLRDGKAWLGVSGGDRFFKLGSKDESTHPAKVSYIDGEPYAKLGNTSWFTNLDHPKRGEFLDLLEDFTLDSYPKYDNYDAIEVGRVRLIPKGYLGAMGVPITFLAAYNPQQFEILGLTNTSKDACPLHNLRLPYDKHDRAYLNGKRMYSRIMIKAKG